MRDRKLAWWLALVGAMAVLAYSSRLTEGKPPRDSLYQYGVAASGLVLYVIVLGLVLWIARGLPREQLGLRRPVSWWRALGLVVALILLVLGVEAVLEPLLHATREQGLEPPRWEPARATPFALNGVVIVLVAPFVEELTFRGLGFGLLLRYGAAVAIIVTAAFFAGAHGLIDGFPALFVFGLAVGILRWRTRSVFPGMLFHACFNGVALATTFIR